PERASARAPPRAPREDRAQHRPGGRAHSRQRLDDGLHGHRRHDQPGLAARVAGRAGNHPGERADLPAGARVLPGPAHGTARRQGEERAGGGLRDRRRERSRDAHGGRRRARSHAARRPRRGAGAAGGLLPAAHGQSGPGGRGGGRGGARQVAPPLRVPAPARRRVCDLLRGPLLLARAGGALLPVHHHAEAVLRPRPGRRRGGGLHQGGGEARHLVPREGGARVPGAQPVARAALRGRGGAGLRGAQARDLRRRGAAPPRPEPAGARGRHARGPALDRRRLARAPGDARRPDRQRARHGGGHAPPRRPRRVADARGAHPARAAPPPRRRRARRAARGGGGTGRRPQRDQLARVLDGGGIDLERELAELESRGIFHRKSLLASDEYRFGESLTQEVAYEGLLLKQRRQLHERVALVLEAEPGEAGPERSALLAHHYARSDNRAKALAALLRAAEDAEDLPSYRTAVDFYRRLWELAEADGDDPT